MKKIIALILLVALLSPAALFAQKAGPGDAVMKWMRENMGMEIGSVSIDGTSYSKVVVAPEVKMGRLKLGLYLPVIYSEDLFDPSSWYQPEGNNEWDFGGGKWGDDIFAASKDALTDLMLKIKYLEYGQQLEDPFFLKLGNLHGLTIGHGLVMRDYRNDADFPSIRRVGVNTGLDFGGVGFEALANDLPLPDILGARLYFRPIKGSKLAFGVSGVADLAAGKDLEAITAWSGVADKFIFTGLGVDMDFPLIKSGGLLGLRAFADAAVTVPYVKESFTSPNTGNPTVDAGLKTDLVFSDGLRNWGAAAGFMGNVLFIDWRLEYRYFTGVFRPAFFDSTYERTRAQLVQEYVGYLDGSSDFGTTPTVMGVYGEAGFSLLGDKLVLEAGYMWPWDPSKGFSLGSTANDELHAALVIRKGLIPIVDIAGAVYYDKWNLVYDLVNGNFAWFDEGTFFAGEVEIPVPSTPNLAVGVIFKAVPKRDDNGFIEYKNNNPADGALMAPTVTIETRFRL